MVIAIDGPAASGKSSTGMAVARALGFVHVDSGALYRAVTRVALDVGTDWTALPAAFLLGEAEVRGLEFRPDDGSLVPFLDGEPAERVIRSEDVTAAVSAVSAVPDVRAWVNERLVAAAASGTPLVMDGRDIGTAVFPDAPVKVFLTATPEARARRRLAQVGGTPDPAAVAAEAARLAARDAADSRRAVAPLRQAEDAVVVDTTDLGFEEQVARIVALARHRLGIPGGGPGLAPSENAG